VAWVLALLLTPLFREIFRHLGIVDHPGGRKLHQGSIPRAGGGPIMLAYTASLLVISLAGGGGAPGSLIDFHAVARLLPGAILIFLVGLADDTRPLNPWHKLAGQVVAALAAFAGGVRVDTVAGSAVPWFVSLPVTVLALLLTTNALNLVDGLDGLCAGIGLFSAITICGSAILLGNYPLAALTFPLAGALTGFLFFNFGRATVFLGDSGALTVGFLLGACGILWNQKSATLLTLCVPLLSLSVPLIDLSLSILRRYLGSRPIFGADRGHIHHRLLDMGLTPRRAVLVLYLFSAAAALVGLLLSNPSTGRHWAILISAALAASAAAIGRLRYRELDAAGALLGEMRGAIAARLHVDALAANLAASQSPLHWWQSLRDFGRAAGWNRLEWVQSGVSEVELLQPERSDWRLEVQIPAGGTVRLEGPADRKLPIDLVQLALALRQTPPPVPGGEQTASNLTAKDRPAIAPLKKAQYTQEYST
jgi:UDP-GlcNAc:undecaprenyl-phosphate GlcNAc-1-phosphate transferase